MLNSPPWRDADRGGREKRGLSLGPRRGRFGRPQNEKMICVEISKRPFTSSHATNTRDIQVSPPDVRDFLFAFKRPSCCIYTSDRCNFRAELVNGLLSTGYIGDRISTKKNCKEIRHLRVARAGNAVRLARPYWITTRGVCRVWRVAGWQCPLPEDADIGRRRPKWCELPTGDRPEQC